MKMKLTAVIYHQRVEEYFIATGGTKQPFAVQVATIIILPLLQPEEVT